MFDKLVDQVDDAVFQAVSEHLEEVMGGSFDEESHDAHSIVRERVLIALLKKYRPENVIFVEDEEAEGKLFEEDFKNPILDRYLELKKSIDYKTVFPTDLQSFLDSLDNTEREGLKRDLPEGKLFVEDEKPQIVYGVHNSQGTWICDVSGTTEGELFDDFVDAMNDVADGGCMAQADFEVGQEFIKMIDQNDGTYILKKKS